MGYYDTQTAVRGSAPQMDVGAFLKSGSLINEALGSIRQRELDANKLAKENELYDMKKEEYNRTLLERKASDAANAELAKGRQMYGGVLNTDALTAEANKNSFTPEELTKYDMYKDSKTARAAGDTALADKMDWQTNLSNVADTLPGNNAVKESRVQMYEGIMDRLNKQGLPIPPTVIASMDQARLFEETENATKLKENTEAQSKNAADQILNAKYAVSNVHGSSGGTQPVTNENGEVVGYTSAAAEKLAINNDNKYDAAIGKGQTSIIEALSKKYQGSEESANKLASALEMYKTVVQADPTIDPEAASAAILLGAGVEESWFPSSLVKDKATFTDVTAKALISKLGNTRTPNTLVGNTTGGSATEGSKAFAASKLSDQISLQQAGTAQQLKDERAKILRGEDGRREDRVNDILMNAGLLDKPETAKEIALKRTSEDYKGVYNTGQGYSDVKSLRDKIAINETGGIDNPYAKVHPSGALGKYGFVPSTAIEQMKALKYTGTNEELLSKFISTPSLQDTIMDNYMNVNAGILSKSGVPVTDWTIWTSHNLGAGNAIKLAKGKIDDSVLDAISKNLPKGMKPTVENYQAHWFDKMNVGDENKKYTAAETKADEVLKKAEETKLSEEGKTTGDSKVDTTKDGINKEDILNRNSSAPLIDVKAEEDLKNVNWYNPIEKAKVRSSLINRGYSGEDADNMISTILKEKAEKTRSDNLIADRNYRAAKRTGSKISGKTAEEWDELRSTKNHIGDYGFLAPIAAASAPIAATVGTLYGGATAATTGIGGTSFAGTYGIKMVTDLLRKRNVEITKAVSRSKQELEKIRGEVLTSKRPSKELIKKQDDLSEYISRANKEIEETRELKNYVLDPKTKSDAATKALDELVKRLNIKE